MIGAQLRKLRLQRNLSQLELSLETGVVQKQISRYETTNLTPQVPTLIKFADYFGVSTDYLLGREQDNPDDRH